MLYQVKEINELSGNALDYAVGFAITKRHSKKAWVPNYPSNEGEIPIYDVNDLPRGFISSDYIDDTFEPSKRWEHAGPIIEKEHIEIYFSETWKAAIKKRIKKTLPNGFQIETDWHKVCSGDTPLIAAMRCFLESKAKENK